MKFKAYLDGEEHDLEIQPIEGGYRVAVDGESHDVDTAKLEGSFYSLISGGNSFEVSVTAEENDVYVVRHGGHRREVRVVDPLAAAAGAHLAHTGRAEITAVMPGRIVKVLVREGDEVAEGQGVVILEAMKMENEVPAPRAGKVTKVAVEAGQTVETGALLCVVE